MPPAQPGEAAAPPHPAFDPAATNPSAADADPTLRLDHFLQRAGLAQTGGHAKLLVQSGEVLLNGTVETRRRKRVGPGDVVECGGQSATVE